MVLEVDLHDVTDDSLIEVKGDIERATLGQILDYRRYAPRLCRPWWFRRNRTTRWWSYC